MPSDVEIANMALTLIGDSTVADITTPEDNDRARACKIWYEPTRDAVLRAHPWGFAKTRVALVATTTPIFDWNYAFTLPTSPYCLRVLEVDDVDNPGSTAWSIEGRTLVTNDSGINILYIARIADPTKFDSLFVEALAAKLAENLAMALTRQKTLIELAHGLYEAKIQEARTVDSMEGSTRVAYAQDLINVRW